jgi:hypothetical protein
MLVILFDSSFSALYPLLIFFLLSSHFSIPKNIPDFHIHKPISANNSGKKNESTQKLLVRPVETVLAPKTVDLVTTTDALPDGVYPEFELVTETLLFRVVVP